MSYTQPILHHLCKKSYLGQFAAQIIETWQANSSIENTPKAIKYFVVMATHSFPGPTHLISICDFQLEKGYTRPQTQANIFICLLDHVYQAPFANMKIERTGWPEIPLILGRSGTQYVAMGIKLLSPNCRAHLVEYYCKE